MWCDAGMLPVSASAASASAYAVSMLGVVPYGGLLWLHSYCILGLNASNDACCTCVVVHLPLGLVVAAHQVPRHLTYILQ